MKDPEAELRFGASPRFQRFVPFLMFTIRYVIPPFIAVIFWFSLGDTIALVFS